MEMFQQWDSVGTILNIFMYILGNDRVLLMMPLKNNNAIKCCINIYIDTVLNYNILCLKQIMVRERVSTCIYYYRCTNFMFSKLFLG
jgi:hypothetical protein